jgi:dipeptidase
MCDTLVALKNSTKNKKVIFAKNSDRQPDEPAEIVHRPAKKYPKGERLTTTYISIPQVQKTNEILLCKPMWIWGGEMGANEYGVTIGNEAIYTKEPYRKKGGLLGMDLLRLGLERGKNAQEALEVIVDLLELYGQGGNCNYRGKLYYHNSFLITDKKEAWVLETADKYWIAEKVKDVRSISNTVSISGAGEIRHPELIEHAIEKGWCKTEEEFDFAEHYCKKRKIEQRVAKGAFRTEKTQQYLCEQKGKIEEKTMMKILRNHHPKTEEWTPEKGESFKSICIHAKNFLNPSQTTISMVSVLDEKIQTHWITGTAAPCTAIFKPVFLPGGLPNIGPRPTKHYDPENLWWRHEELHRLTLRDYKNRLTVYKEEKEELEEEFLEQTERMVAAIKTKKELEGGDKNQLLKFSYQRFKEAKEAEKEWIELVRNTPILKGTGICYKLFWNRRNRWNKMPKIK